MRKISWILLCVLVVGLLFGCSKAKEGLLPQSIAEFELASKTSGEEAQKSVTSMHGGAKMKLEEVEIGEYYSGNSKATLWIGKAKNSNMAKMLMKTMTEKISKGKSPFGEPVKTTIDGVKAVEMEAMGQKHYYYQTKSKVVWLSVDSSLAKETITDLISTVK